VWRSEGSRALVNIHFTLSNSTFHNIGLVETTVLELQHMPDQLLNHVMPCTCSATSCCRFSLTQRRLLETTRCMHHAYYHPNMHTIDGLPKQCGNIFELGDSVQVNDLATSKIVNLQGEGGCTTFILKLGLNYY